MHKGEIDDQKYYFENGIEFCPWINEILLGWNYCVQNAQTAQGGKVPPTGIEY